MKNKRHVFLDIFKKHPFFWMSLSYFFASFLFLTFLNPDQDAFMRSLIAAFSTIAGFLLANLCFPSSGDDY